MDKLQVGHNNHIKPLTQAVYVDFLSVSYKPYLSQPCPQGLLCFENGGYVVM